MVAAEGFEPSGLIGYEPTPDTYQHCDGSGPRNRTLLVTAYEAGSLTRGIVRNRIKQRRVALDRTVATGSPTYLYHTANGAALCLPCRAVENTLNSPSLERWQQPRAPRGSRSEHAG